MLVGILICLFASGLILICSSELKCHPSFRTSLVVSTNKLNINDISGFVLINAPVVLFNCVIGDYPQLTLFWVA
jgi:hypothetical protein